MPIWHSEIQARLERCRLPTRHRRCHERDGIFGRHTVEAGARAALRACTHKLGVQCPVLGKVDIPGAARRCPLMTQTDIASPEHSLRMAKLVIV
jgi:hypothetical protein